MRDNNLELVREILWDLAHLAERSSLAAELARILQEPHFQVHCWWLRRVPSKPRFGGTPGMTRCPLLLLPAVPPGNT